MDTAMRAFRFVAAVSCLVATPALAQKPRDISKLDPCKVLMPADLAATTKGKVSSTVGGGVGAAACLWVVDAPTGAGTYQLFLEKAELTETVLKVKTPAEKGTPVAGMWTEAYMVPPGTHGDQYILTVLNRGDMAIEVHGVNKDAVTALGRLAVSRLK
jgi:hypothetical protein